MSWQRWVLVAPAVMAGVALARRLWRRSQRRVVLVTGASGYLGQHLLSSLVANRDAHQHLVVHATYGSNQHFVEDWGSSFDCHSLSLDDASATADLLARLQPDVVVHLAAVSSPAKAEADPAWSRGVNCPLALLDALPPRASIIFLSTDQVYEGTQAPYRETDEAKPVNVYGESKLAFEEAMAARVPARGLALRMSLLLGPPAPKRSNKQRSFLQDCERMLASGRAHDFFSDEFRSVVALDDVLRVLHWAIDGGALAHPGVYNMGGPGRLSRSNIAHAVARHLQLPESGIRAVARPPPQAGGAHSPPDIAMDSSKLETVAGVRFRPLEHMLASAFPATADRKSIHECDREKR